MDEGGGGGGSVRILIAIDLFGLFLIFIILLSFTMKMCCIYIHPPWKCLQLPLFAGGSACAGTNDQPSFLNQLFWSFMGLGSVYISVQAMFSSFL